jgi:large subunit ribosomal protein L25
MNKIQLKAEKRELGGGALKATRRSGNLPAVIYGHNFKSVPVQVRVKDFEGAYAQAGESSLIYVDLGDNSLPVIIHDVAKDAISDQFVHADFYKVNLDEKVTTDIPLVFVGESPAVKGLGGILVKNIKEITVEALPQDLPHEIEVDISGLQNFGGEILIKDLKLPAGVEVKDKLDSIIVLVQEPISQEELDKQLAVPVGGVEDVEVIKKEKEEEAPAGEEVTSGTEEAK